MNDETYEAYREAQRKLRAQRKPVDEVIRTPVITCLECGAKAMELVKMHGLTYFECAHCGHKSKGL